MDRAGLGRWLGRSRQSGAWEFGSKLPRRLHCILGPVTRGGMYVYTQDVVIAEGLPDDVAAT